MFATFEPLRKRLQGRHIALVACIAIALAVAACFRLPGLAARPMHADEANQAVRAGWLWDKGEYEYDVADHHGPSLYWLTLPVLALTRATDFAHTDEWQYRLVPVAFGLGLIVLLLLVADALGPGPTVAAALLTAISPAMVFYSRYYIQEMLLVFFTLAAIASGWRYFRTRSIGWAVAFGASLGLMHATKETWVLAAAAMAGGLAMTIVYGWCRDGAVPQFRPYLRPLALVAAAGAACAVAAAFYSSFGRNWHGPWDSVRAYVNYVHRGSEGGVHLHPWYQYFEWLFAFRPARGFFWTEGLIGLLALVGVLAAGRRSADPSPALHRAAFCRFLAFYTLLLTFLYAAIPYKTPWCLLSFLHGMILLAGLGAWTILARMPGRWAKAVALVLLAAGAAQLGSQAYALSFRYSADPRNPYVYAHSSGDVLKLAAQLERLAHASPEGHEMLVNVVTPENYWPVPWYLRRFSHVGYWQDAAEWRADAGRRPPSVILFSSEVQPDVDAAFPGAYNQQMIYGIRPGVLLSVYVRNDLWEAFLQSAGG